MAKYTCPKCGSTVVAFIDGSDDEGKATARCFACGHTWLQRVADVLAWLMEEEKSDD